MVELTEAPSKTKEDALTLGPSSAATRAMISTATDPCQRILFGALSRTKRKTVLVAGVLRDLAASVRC